MPKHVFQAHLQDSGASKNIFELPTCYQAAEWKEEWKIPLKNASLHLARGMQGDIW